jgi:hypothetical protein
MPEYKLNIEKDWPVRKKVETLQRFLGEHYIHDSGMMYTMWHWKGDDLRPFKKEDFGPFKVLAPSADISPTPEGYLHCENSAQLSGEFLASQAIRYRVTGEAEAMEFSRRAFNSIDTIFKLTEAKGHRGFLSKPYNWSASNETSPDQYISVIHGLWEYRKIADRASVLRIDELIPAMADWWRQKEYILTYFKIWWPILPHHAPAMAGMHSMAYKVTGDPVYLEECRRLLTIAGSWPTWMDRNRRELTHNTGFPVETKGVRWPKELEGREYDPSRKPYLLRMHEIGEVWLTTVWSDYFMQYDESMTPLLKHAISRQYRNIQVGLRDDLFGHYMVQYDLERDIWKPIPHVPRTSSWYTFYDGDLCWQDGIIRIIDMSAIAHHHAPEFCPGALNMAKKFLQTLDNRRLHWFVDPVGGQLEADEEPMLHTLSPDVPAFTCLGYWRAKAYKLPID